MFRVFAPEEESVRKYALILWGRTENQVEKITGYRKSVSDPYCFHYGRRKSPFNVIKKCSFTTETASFY